MARSEFNERLRAAYEQRRLTDELRRSISPKRNGFWSVLRTALPLIFSLQPLVVREQPFIEKLSAHCASQRMLTVIFIALLITTG